MILVAFLGCLSQKTEPVQTYWPPPTQEHVTAAVSETPDYDLQVSSSPPNEAWADGVFRKCRAVPCGHLDVATWNGKPIYVKESGHSADPALVSQDGSPSSYWAYIFNYADNVWAIQYVSPALTDSEGNFYWQAHEYVSATNPWEAPWPQRSVRAIPYVEPAAPISVMEPAAPVEQPPAPTFEVQSESILYVQASTANLRSEPGRHGLIVAGLAIAAKGEVLKQEGGWVYLQSGEHIGWVDASLLGATEPTLEEALAQFNAADTWSSERRKWIERAAALAPTDREVIDLLIETLEQQGDSDALRKARLGKRALQTMDSAYFTHQSFQDGDPEDYLQIYPSPLSCREEIRALATQGASFPNDAMIAQWGGWYREVPKEEFWPTLQQQCYEFQPNKTLWSLIAKDDVASWQEIELQPTLTVRTFLEEPCDGRRMGVEKADVNLAWSAPTGVKPVLYYSSPDPQKTTAFSYLQLTAPKAVAVPGLVSAEGNPIHRSVLMKGNEEFGIESLYMDHEMGDVPEEYWDEKNIVLKISLVVEWTSGQRTVLHSAEGILKYSYHPPEIGDIVVTDLNQDGFPDFLLSSMGIGYQLMETRNQTIHSIQTIERPMDPPIGGC